MLTPEAWAVWLTALRMTVREIGIFRWSLQFFKCWLKRGTNTRWDNQNRLCTVFVPQAADRSDFCFASQKANLRQRKKTVIRGSASSAGDFLLGSILQVWRLWPGSADGICRIFLRCWHLTPLGSLISQWSLLCPYGKAGTFDLQGWQSVWIEWCSLIGHKTATWFVVVESFRMPPRVSRPLWNTLN